jgi:hypothetical protein
MRRVNSTQTSEAKRHKMPLAVKTAQIAGFGEDGNRHPDIHPNWTLDLTRVNLLRRDTTKLW